MQSLLEWFGAKPTLESFTGRLLTAMPRVEAAGWRFDKGEATLVNGAGSTISLQNIFLEYSNASRRQRPGLIDKYLELARTITQEIPALWVAAAKNVYPVLRSKYVATAVEVATRGRAKPMDRFAAAPLAGDLQVCLMYDFGESLKYVHEPQLSIWGQSYDDVRERALANLAKLEPAVWVADESGFFQLASRASYAESMLLLDRIVDALPFRDNAVFVPCNRGVLLAADAHRDDAVSAMLREAIRCAELAPWPMSATLCTRRDRSWTVWEPSDATRALAHDLFLIHLAMSYQAQQEALEEWQNKNGIDRYVAKFDLRKRPDGLVSFATWTQGVCTLLPISDLVALVRPSAKAGEMEFKLARWQNVIDVCAHRLRPTDESPTRYELDSFPDEAEWNRLKDERDVVKGGQAS